MSLNKNSEYIVFARRGRVHTIVFKIYANIVVILSRYAVPDSPYAIQSNIHSTELNNLVNVLLKEAIPSIEKAVEFDFLVCGELLCTPLSEHLQEKGVSTEETLELEYLERFPAPTPQDCLMHDDWVSAVQAHGNWLVIFKCLPKFICTGDT